MKQKDFEFLMNIVFYGAMISTMITAYMGVYNIPGAQFLEYNLINIPKAIFLSTWLFMIQYAWRQSHRHAQKIKKHKRIYHGLAAAGRIGTFLFLFISMKYWESINHFLAFAMAVCIGLSFSMLFNLRLNHLRNLPPLYFPEKPHWYDKIFTVFPPMTRARCRMLIEAFGALIGICILFYL